MIEAGQRLDLDVHVGRQRIRPPRLVRGPADEQRLHARSGQAVEHDALVEQRREPQRGQAAIAAPLAAAGADEAILVVSPITEASIRTLGAALAALDRA